ncbi:MAG: hypothetical protein ACKVPX_18370 [Myxococcaceae bacterium]
MAAGEFDTYIREYGRALKAYGQPVFFRLISRHTVDLLREEGTSNAVFVWTTITFPSAPANAANWGIDPDINSYYPGDDYVDWISADHYDYGDPNNPVIDPLNVAQWLNPSHDFAALHGKPFLLAEWGVRSGLLTPPQMQTWIGLMFDYFASHPRIKAINYFNLNFARPVSTAGHVFLCNNQVNYAPNVNDGDGRLLAESEANFRSTYAARITTPRYVSALSP